MNGNREGSRTQHRGWTGLSHAVLDKMVRDLTADEFEIGVLLLRKAPHKDAGEANWGGVAGPRTLTRKDARTRGLKWSKDRFRKALAGLLEKRWFCREPLKRKTSGDKAGTFEDAVYWVGPAHPECRPLPAAVAVRIQDPTSGPGGPPVACCQDPTSGPGGNALKAAPAKADRPVSGARPKPLHQDPTSGPDLEVPSGGPAPAPVPDPPAPQWVDGAPLIIPRDATIKQPLRDGRGWHLPIRTAGPGGRTRWHGPYSTKTAAVEARRAAVSTPSLSTGAAP